MNFRYCLAFVFLMVSTFSVHCQEGFFYHGRIVDSKTLEPIPYATIQFLNSNEGLISNPDGSFQIPAGNIKKRKQILFSCIGYASLPLSLDDFSMATMNIVKMEESIEVLNEVVVTVDRKKRLSARKIVKKALQKIPENLPKQPFAYSGYYRDYQVDSLNNYINLNEAILQIQDFGIAQKDAKTKIGLIDYTRNSNFRRDSMASIPYDYINKKKVIPEATLRGSGGNELRLLRLHDAIRNYNLKTYDFVQEFQKDFLRKHDFDYSKETVFNDKTLHEITFQKDSSDFIAKGLIHIFNTDFKIKKLSYKVSKIKKEGNNQKCDKLFEIIVEYKEYLNKMYPSYISFNNAFDVLDEPLFKVINFNVDVFNRLFKVTFNNTPLEQNAISKGNYAIYINDRLVNIDKVVLLGNMVTLFPETKKSFDGVTEDDRFFVNIENVEDVEGNLINYRIPRHYRQFREFFSQKIFDQGEYFPFDNESLILDNLPISEIKPKLDEGKNGIYWKNTPLLKIEY